MKLRNFLFALCLIILSEMFVCGLVILSKQSFKHTQQKPPIYSQQKQQLESGIRYNGPVNMLLLGLDQEEIRTDTILFVNFSSSESKFNILSIERDTQVSVDGKKRKINSLYAIEKEKYVIQVVEKITSLPVHYYVTVDFKGFRKIIDTLGGVQFDVPFDMDYDDPSQNLHIHLDKGMQLLDGDKAEQLVRYRKGNRRGEGYIDGDIGRIATQQKFLKALISQKLKFKYLSRVNDLFTIVTENVRTNVSIDDVTYYLSGLSGVKAANIKSFTMPGDSSYEDGVWYFFYNRKKTLELINKNFYK